MKYDISKKKKKKKTQINKFYTSKNHLQSAQLKEKYLSHIWKIKYITLKYKIKWIA